MKAWLRRPWAWLALLLVVVKAALVLALGDVFFYGEELEKGTAAKAMLDGLEVPHHQLAYHYYEGGGFVISHAAAVAFLLVGQNLLAHKLVALGFQLALLAAGCAFVRRLFGRAAALWFGLLFVFGPETYQKLSLISLGIHFEACIFLFLVLGLGAQLLFTPNSKLRTWFFLGLVTGFGLYFSYQIAIAALWVALMLVLFRRRELIGLGGLLGLSGTALGALPLIVMYSLVGEAVFDIHGTSIAGEGTGPSNSVLFREFLESIFVEGSLGGRAAPYLWTSAAVLFGVFLLGRSEPPRHPSEHSRKHATLYVLGYLTLFLITYLSSGFVQGRAYHHFLLLRLVPLWVFGSVLVAGGLGTLSDSVLRAPRHLALVLGGVLLAFGGRASWAVLQGGTPGKVGDNWRILTKHKGYAYDQYFAKVLPHFEGSRAQKLALIEGFDEEDRGLLRADAVKNLFRDQLLAEEQGDLLAAWAKAREVIEEVAGGDESRRAESELGLGALLTVAHGWDRARAFAAVAAAPQSERPAAFEALGRFGGGGYPLPEALRREAERAASTPGSEGYLRGLGRWAYLLHRLRPAGIEEVIADWPEPWKPPFRAGFEAERAWNLAH